ncbi:hypothetical protein [uncultured Thiocystis sp.]|jgi:hypothetical protein|uniref:hypothetical protein n=1 Tax=uncultured Thiocystis sp. TaxID=1202134 RepID=UPI0025E6ECE6|nr:hypothetical protein [uncultured Thiocystis sp.]
MAKVFLHIGINKAGSSAVQYFFNHNREKAKQFRLLYPITACANSAHHSLMYFLCSKPGTQTKKNDYLEKSRKFRESLDLEIELASPTAILLSSEYLVNPNNIAPVKDFFDQDEVRILVYLRRHDTWWESLYNQTAKTVMSPRWGSGFDAFVRFRKNELPGYGNFRRLLERWSAVFGQRNLIVRPYEWHQNKPDIVVDLLHAIGADMGVDTVKIPLISAIRSVRRNESLPRHALRLIEIFQKAKIPQDIRARLIHHARSLPVTEPRQSILSPARRLQLIEENAADYEYIAREYLGRDDGRLFYDPLPDPNEPWEAPQRLAPQQIVEETVKALTDSRQDAKA